MNNDERMKPVTVKITIGGRIVLTKPVIDRLDAEIGDSVMIYEDGGKICIDKLRSPAEA